MPSEMPDLLTQDKRLLEIKKCMNSFEYFCENYIKILHPMRGLVPFRLYDYQKRVVSDYEKYPYNIISKFRQGGLTTVTILWGLWRAIFKCDQQILVVTKTDREAKAASQILKRAMEYLPDWIKPPLRKDNDHEVQFAETGGSIGFFTPEAARGRALTYLIIDEAAFIPGMDDHWKALFPVLSTGGKCIVISTVNGVGNWYEEEYHRAVEGKNQFHVIELDYTEHPDYNNEEWVRKMKANLGEQGWRQEVLRQFLGSGSSYFPSDVIGDLDMTTRKIMPFRKLFGDWDAGLSFDDDQPDFLNENYERGAMWVWKEPEVGREYIIAADVAEGIGGNGDFSAFHVFDTVANEQVAEFYSNTIPLHLFAQVLNEVGFYYNTALLIIENTGPGLAVLLKLEHQIYYPNLYYSQVTKSSQKAGISTSKSNRQVILEAMKAYLINRLVKINSMRLVREMKTFEFNNQLKRAEAARGKHDDLIMAMAILLHVKDSMFMNNPIGYDMGKEDGPLKDKVFHDLRRELESGASDEWLEINKILSKDVEEEDYLPRIMINYKRSHDALLKEFGW